MKRSHRLRRLSVPRSAQDRRRPVRLRECRALVAGLNALGRLVAQHLAVLGPGRLMLIDSRRVSRTDCRAQGYFAEDLGRLRVHATAELCHRLNPRLDIRTSARRPGRRPGTFDAVFWCEDPAPRRDLGASRGPISAPFIVEGAVAAHRVTVRALVRGSGRVAGWERHASGAGRAARLESLAWPSVYWAAGLMILEFQRFLRRRGRSRKVWLDLHRMQVTQELGRRCRDQGSAERVFNRAAARPGSW